MSDADSLPKEEQVALTSILEHGEPIAADEFKTGGGMDREDPVAFASATEEDLAGEDDPVVEGLVQSWVFDKIAAAVSGLGDTAISPESGDVYSKVEDAVWAAALAGKLGDGTPSEATAVAIADLVNQLMQDSMPDAVISDTPIDVQPVSLPGEQPSGLDGQDVQVGPVDAVPGDIPIVPVTLASKEPPDLMKAMTERYLRESDETNTLEVTEDPALDTPKSMMEMLNPYQVKALQIAKTVWGDGWKTRLKNAWETQDYGDLDGLTVDCLEQVKVLTDASTSGLKAADPDAVIDDDEGLQSPASVRLPADEPFQERRRRFRTTESGDDVRRMVRRVVRRASEAQSDIVDTILEHGMEAAVEEAMTREN